MKTSKIGKGTSVWQYCVISGGAQIGADCNICAHVFIEDDVIIGDSVTIKSGVQLWDGIRISNNVFLGPNVTFANDKFPRSKQYPSVFMQTKVGDGASIGANATILPGITIGRGAMVGAGTVVTRDVPAFAVVVGNPGVVTRYVKPEPNTSLTHPTNFRQENREKTDLTVGNCSLSTLPSVKDARGILSFAELEKNIPFNPKRCFWITNVPDGGVRGQHAHKELHQYLICLKGSVTVALDDSKFRTEVKLDVTNVGLHIPPKVWATQYKYSSDSVLLVMASSEYDESDYLRDYEEFLIYMKKQ